MRLQVKVHIGRIAKPAEIATARRRAASDDLHRAIVLRSCHALLVRCSLRVSVVGLGMLLLLAPTGRLHAQDRPSAGPYWRQSDNTSPFNGDTATPQMQLKRLRALNAARQKSLVSDTDKLLRLTADLNVQINGAHPASLTDAQLRMVEEIEKLARNIREKMSTPIDNIPQLGPRPSPPPLPSFYPQ